VKALLWIAALSATAVAVGAPPAGEASDPAAFQQRFQRTLSEVLSEPEFAERPLEQPSWWRRLWRWIADLLESAAEAASSLPAWLFWLIVGWLVLALAAVLVHMLWTLYQLISTGGAASSAAWGRGRAAEILGIRDLDYESVLAQGHVLAERGRFADAVRYLYVAAILGLERQGAVHVAPAKTNRDYLRELHSAVALRPLFQRMTERYELIAYGGAPADRASCAEMLANLEALQA
jgi:hypothetical protein